MARPTTGYKLQDGTRVPGTTTITSRFADSGGLLYWAFEQGKAAERGEIRSLYDKRDEAGDYGTQIHDLVEAHVKGNPCGVENAPEPVRRGFEAYCEWAAMTSLEIIETETPLVSEVYKFGGTPDGIGLVNGKLSMVDYKTGKGVYPSMLAQLGAYAILWDEHRPDQPLTGGFHLLNFKKETGDFAHYYFGDLADAREYFLLIRRAYELDKRLKRRV